ncbi:uncharacterized protein THITE_2049609, partial [Thermothielavioides terrestris NRRL 8126]
IQAFIDNIVIYLDDAKDYIQYLDTIFSLFANKNIAFSLAKLYIGYLSVELLSFYVDSLSLTTTI